MAPAFGVYAMKAGLQREDGSERMLAGGCEYRAAANGE